MAQLGELTSNEATGRWAKEVLRLLRELGPEISGQPEKAAATLQELQGLAAKETSLEAAVGDRAALLGLSRARYALVRRIDVWSEVCRIGASNEAEAQGPLHRSGGHAGVSGGNRRVAPRPSRAGGVGEVPGPGRLARLVQADPRGAGPHPPRLGA